MRLTLTPSHQAACIELTSSWVVVSAAPAHAAAERLAPQQATPQYAVRCCCRWTLIEACCISSALAEPFDAGGIGSCGVVWWLWRSGGRARAPQVRIDSSIEFIILLILCSLRWGQRCMPFSRQIFFSTVVHTPSKPASTRRAGQRRPPVIIGSNSLAVPSGASSARKTLTRDVHYGLVKVDCDVGERHLPVRHRRRPRVCSRDKEWRPVSLRPHEERFGCHGANGRGGAGGGA